MQLENILQADSIPLTCSICQQTGETCIVPCRFPFEFTCEHMCGLCLEAFLKAYPRLFEHIRMRELGTIRRR